jgi:hypothetical protein
MPSLTEISHITLLVVVYLSVAALAVITSLAIHWNAWPLFSTNIQQQVSSTQNTHRELSLVSAPTKENFRDSVTSSVEGCWVNEQNPNTPEYIVTNTSLASIHSVRVSQKSHGSMFYCSKIIVYGSDDLVNPWDEVGIIETVQQITTTHLAKPVPYKYFMFSCCCDAKQSIKGLEAAKLWVCCSIDLLMLA